MAKFTADGMNARIQKLPPATPQPAAVTNLTATNPAVLTVALTEVGKFRVGDAIVIANAPAAASTANGSHNVTAVNYSTGAVSVDVNGASWVGGPFANPAGMTIKPTKTQVQVNISGITNAKPAVITIASGDAPLFITGNLVTLSGTGAVELDGKTFRIGTVASTTVVLLGSDTSAHSGSITAGVATIINPSDMLLFCLSSWERAVDAADAIDVSTFCGSESLPGTPQPGTVDIEGFVNFDEAALIEWMNGVSDGQVRTFTLEPPVEVGGQIIFRATPSGYTETFAVGEAASFSGSAVILNDPIYLVGANKP